MNYTIYKMLGNNLRLLTLFFICLNFYACQEKEVDDIKTYNISLDLKNTVNIEKFITDVKTLKLELCDASLIKKVSKLEYYKEYIFVLDSSQDIIFIFNNAGKYLNRIESKGRGPKEYIGIDNFRINTYKETIEVIDPFRQNKLTFSFAGEFMKLQNLVQIEGTYSNFEYINADKILFTTYDRTNRLKVYNIEENKIEVELMPGSIDFRSDISLFDKNMIYEEFSNVIYQYQDNYIESAYRINIDNLSNELKVNNIDEIKKDQISYIGKLLKSEISDYWINKINGSSKMIYFSFIRKNQGYIYLINKNTGDYFSFESLNKDFNPLIAFIDDKKMVGVFDEDFRESYDNIISLYHLDISKDEEMEDSNIILVEYLLR